MKGLKRFVLLVAVVLPMSIILAACGGESKAFWGDVTMTGTVTYIDSLVIMKHVYGELQLSAEALARADVDGDGFITSTDAYLVKLYVDGKVDSLDPNNFNIVWGDVNGDGKVDEADRTTLQEFLNGSGVAINKTNARVHIGGADRDLGGEDSTILARYLSDSYAWLEVNTLPFFIANNWVGDVNCDGVVDADDVAYLTAFHAGTQTLSLQSICNAGVKIGGAWQFMTPEFLAGYIESL